MLQTYFLLRAVYKVCSFITYLRYVTHTFRENGWEGRIWLVHVYIIYERSLNDLSIYSTITFLFLIKARCTKLSLVISDALLVTFTKCVEVFLICSEICESAESMSEKRYL